MTARCLFDEAEQEIVTTLYPCASRGMCKVGFDGFACSRPVGHDGPHVAHGVRDQAVAIDESVWLAEAERA